MEIMKNELMKLEGYKRAMEDVISFLRSRLSFDRWKNKNSMSAELRHPVWEDFLKALYERDEKNENHH